jgi:hypothetical protein
MDIHKFVCYWDVIVLVHHFITPYIIQIGHPNMIQIFNSDVVKIPRHKVIGGQH